MAGLEKKVTAFQDENLSGRSQKLFFEVTEEENFTILELTMLILTKELAIDCEGMDAKELNQKIRDALNKRLWLYSY